MLRVKCPAKINLTLEVLDKRPDGFHNIQSVMQTISLYDILTIDVKPSDELKINLSGTSREIPYNEKNLVYKACLLFCEKIKQNLEISVYIEKNIPVSAGLAGGSTDGAGVLFGLNQILKEPLTKKEIHELCAKLGSDLNFCLEGGCKLATGRGEILKDLPYREFDVCLIKPKNLGISAREAYTKFSQLKNKPNLNMTEKYVNGDFSAVYNDLEIALINDYAELKLIKSTYPNSIMSGSGSTFFVLDKTLNTKISDDYEIYENLKSVPYGVIISNKV